MNGKKNERAGIDSAKMKLAMAAGLSVAAMAAQSVKAAAILLPGAGYTQNFDNLLGTASAAYTGGTVDATVLPNGWSILENSSNATNSLMSINNGSSNTGDTYLFGTAGSPERSLGGTASGTVQTEFGASFTNNTGGMITSIAISYTGEQWRQGGNTSTQALFFDYSTSATSLPTRGGATATVTGLTAGITAAGFTPATALNFVSPVVNAPVTTASLTAATNLDGNAAANRLAISSTISGLNIPAGGSFFIRWQDLNDVGNDHGLGVDDITITPTFTAPAASVSLVDTATPTLGTVTVNGIPAANAYIIDNAATGGATSGVLGISGDLATAAGAPVLVFLDLANPSDASILQSTFGSQSGLTVTPGSFTFGAITYDALFQFAANPNTSGDFDFTYDFSQLGAGGIAVNNIGVVPEPTTLGVIGMGVLAAGLRRRRRA